MKIEWSIVYHKLLWKWIITETSWEQAMVYFPKRVPLTQIFPSQEAMLWDWRNDTLHFIEELKKTKAPIEKTE